MTMGGKNKLLLNKTKKKYICIYKVACFHGKIVILPHRARSCASMNVSVYIRSDLQRKIIIKKKKCVILFKKIKLNFSVYSVSIADVTKHRLPVYRES